AFSVSVCFWGVRGDSLDKWRSLCCGGRQRRPNRPLPHLSGQQINHLSIGERLAGLNALQTQRFNHPDGMCIPHLEQCFPHAVGKLLDGCPALLCWPARWPRGGTVDGGNGLPVAMAMFFRFVWMAWCLLGMAVGQQVDNRLHRIAIVTRPQ